jgi:hypothetical protein
MRFKITVTQQDINGGKRHGVKTCPVARAINRTFTGNVRGNESVYARVGYGSCAFSSEGPDSLDYLGEAAFPRSVDRFIKTFDAKGGRKAVKPFSFWITIDNKMTTEQFLSK